MRCLTTLPSLLVSLAALAFAYRVEAQSVTEASRSRHVLTPEVVVDVILPPRPSHQAAPPVALLIPGGGWSSSDRSAMYPLAQHLVTRGLAVVVTSYRHAPEHPWPAQLEDVSRVLAWVRKHARAQHLDPDRVVAIGASAGGMLAAHLGSRPDRKHASLRANRVIAVSAPWDLLGAAQSFAKHQWAAHPAYPDVSALGMMSNLLGWPLDPARLKHASPYWHLNRNSSPTLLIHGETDSLVPLHQSQMVCEKLKQYPVPCTLVVIPQVGHTMDERFLAPMLAFLGDWLPPP